MSHPMTRLCDRFEWKELNSHSFAPCRRVVDRAGGLSSRCSRSSNLMYLCGKAIHVSRRAGKASKQHPSCDREAVLSLLARADGLNEGPLAYLTTAEKTSSISRLVEHPEEDMSWSRLS